MPAPGRHKVLGGGRGGCQGLGGLCQQLCWVPGDFKGCQEVVLGARSFVGCLGLSWVPCRVLCLALPCRDSLAGTGSGWPMSRSARSMPWLTGWGTEGLGGGLGRVPVVLGNWEVPGHPKGLEAAGGPMSSREMWGSQRDVGVSEAPGGARTL